MKKVSGTAQCRNKSVDLVKGSVLIGFLQAQMAAIAQACTKVTQGNGLEGASELCRYYIDGALYVMNSVFDCLGPVKVQALLKLVATITSSVDANFTRMVEDTGTSEVLCKVWAEGVHKMADVIVNAMSKAKDADEEVSTDD